MLNTQASTKWGYDFLKSSIMLETYAYPYVQSRVKICLWGGNNMQMSPKNNILFAK